MLNMIVRKVFDRFDWQALTEKEAEALESGVIKHQKVLRFVIPILVPQIALNIIAPDLAMLVTVTSFISLLLGGAWYAISFRDVADAQLSAGVADFITRKMFRGFVLSFDMLIMGTVFYVIKALLPEIPFPSSPTEVPLMIRVPVMWLNIFWILVVWYDVYQASVAYDASDSLLGDGFPTLMRGAKATTSNLPLLRSLERLVDLLDKEKKEGSSN